MDLTGLQNRKLARCYAGESLSRKLNLHAASLAKISLHRYPAKSFRVIISCEALISGDLYFFGLYDQINPIDTAGDLATIPAMANVSSALGAEEIVVIDLDFDCLTEACAFHFGS